MHTYICIFKTIKIDMQMKRRLGHVSNKMTHHIAAASVTNRFSVSDTGCDNGE